MLSLPTGRFHMTDLCRRRSIAIQSDILKTHGTYNTSWWQTLEQTLGVLVWFGILDALLNIWGCTKPQPKAALRYLQASCWSTRRISPGSKLEPSGGAQTPTTTDRYLRMQSWSFVKGEDRQDREDRQDDDGEPPQATTEFAFVQVCPLRR